MTSDWKANVLAKVHPDWHSFFEKELNAPYFERLRVDVQNERKTQVVYPPAHLVFELFRHCSPSEVKVVILGQDPYHNPNEAEGLSFSVPPGVKVPPSLRNIYKELHADLGVPPAQHGHLGEWVKEGIFLLNTVLTVRQGQADSHKQLGWQFFTDAVIRYLSDEPVQKVFLLWGNKAREKKPLIDTEKHCILESAHPSPLSAHNGFFSCKHFSKANAFLEEVGRGSVDWAAHLQSGQLF